MTKQPPRLALALLARFVPDDGPLAGDLIEEFEIRRSHMWFWRQVLAAILTRWLAPSDELRTIVLPRTVNLSAAPAGSGVGGLGVVVLASLVTIVMPQAWWIVALGVAAGVLFGVVLIAINRTRLG
jgi:hypothetical protein